jgi:hypothetical protein
MYIYSPLGLFLDEKRSVLLLIADDVVTDGGVACCNALFVKNKKKVRTREMNRTNLKKWSQ